MTPCEVTGHPMKPTKCNSGQCSATACTDLSVTCRGGGGRRRRRRERRRERRRRAVTLLNDTRAL